MKRINNKQQSKKYKELRNLFKSDEILITITDTLKNYVKLKGFKIMDYNEKTSQLHLPLYSTKLLIFFDIPNNSLHIDKDDRIIKNILHDPDYIVDNALSYFRDIRNIPEMNDTQCWIYIGFFFRTISFYITIRNSNIKEIIDKEGIISYVNIKEEELLLSM